MVCFSIDGLANELHPFTKKTGLSCATVLVACLVVDNAVDDALVSQLFATSIKSAFTEVFHSSTNMSCRRVAYL